VQVTPLMRTLVSSP